jgi:hypothetical protein
MLNTRFRQLVARRRFLVVLSGVAILIGLTVAVAVVLSSRRGSNMHLLAQVRSYSHCMRSHGLPAFPEPTLSSSGVNIRTPVSLQRSSFYASARSACRDLLPMASGG